MANYSDLTTMFNIRHWFEFKNGSNLGLDSITSASLLSINGPVSNIDFKEDPAYPGFPTIGDSLFISNSDPITYVNASAVIVDMAPVLATGTDSISFTAIFNYIDTPPPGSPPPAPPGTPVVPPGTPRSFSVYSDASLVPPSEVGSEESKPFRPAKPEDYVYPDNIPDNIKATIIARELSTTIIELQDDIETRDLTPPPDYEEQPRVPGQNPCMPPYIMCFPKIYDTEYGSGCTSASVGLRVKSSNNTDDSFLTLQDTAWYITGASYEFTEDYGEDHFGEFYWTWYNNWSSSKWVELDALPYIEQNTGNAETNFYFGNNTGAPVVLEFEVIDTGSCSEHYGSTTAFMYEQVFNVESSVTNGLARGFKEAWFAIVDKDLNSDTITAADVDYGWHAWTMVDGVTVEQEIISEGVQVLNTKIEGSSNLEGVFFWDWDDSGIVDPVYNPDGINSYINSSDGYNYQRIGTTLNNTFEGANDLYRHTARLDMRNKKIVAHLDLGSYIDTYADSQIYWSPMGCVTKDPIEEPIPTMSIFNITGSNDDIVVLIDQSADYDYLSVLNNNIKILDYQCFHLSDVFTMTASINRKYNYDDTQFLFSTLEEEEKIFTIPGAEYLLVTIDGRNESCEPVVDIYDANDMPIYSCRSYDDIFDEIKVIGDTARVVVRKWPKSTLVSVTDQNSNRQPSSIQEIFKLYLDGGLILEEEIQTPATSITSFALTSQKDIEPAGTPIPVNPFAGTIAELIISDKLESGDVFRLHSILNGLFDTDTLEDVQTNYDSFFWHKFVNGKIVGDDRIASFNNYDEIYDASTASVYPDRYISNSEEYSYSLSCQRAFYIDYNAYSIWIEKEGYRRTPEMINKVDLSQVHYSTHLVHINPKDSPDIKDEYGNKVQGPILMLGDEDQENIIIGVKDVFNGGRFCNLYIRIKESRYSNPVFDETFLSIVPLNKPFILYVRLDAVSTDVAVDGNMIYSGKTGTQYDNDWSPILSSYTIFTSTEETGEGPTQYSPQVYISDYIQYKGPLTAASLRKISSIYHAGDPSYSRMDSQIPTIENMHHMYTANHRLNLSNSVNRGLDIITGKRIPVTFTGSRYSKIPGQPNIEGIVLDGTPEKRGCSISQLNKKGYFKTGCNFDSWVENDDTLGQVITIGTLIYHDDLKKFNLLRWTGAINPEENYVEAVISARGYISLEMSIDGLNIPIKIENTASNFGLNSFYLVFSLYVRTDGYVQTVIQIYFDDKMYKINANIDLSSTTMTEQIFIDTVSSGSTLEIGGGANINAYMDGSFNMSGIISDITFFSDIWDQKDNDNNMIWRTNSDQPPGAMGAEKGHGGLGKGGSGSGLTTVNSHDAIEHGVDSLPISGVTAALLISETNDMNSPVMTMRPIVDTKVSDGFAGAPYTETYLVPIPSCSGVDMSIFKIAVTDPFTEESRLSISDSGSNSNYYWHAYSNANREYFRREQWLTMLNFNYKTLESYPFCNREGLVYDFTKYNGKIVFSFLARYAETDKDTAYGDKELNHHNEQRGKRLYHYNHMGYFDQSIISELKWSYKYFDDGSNGELGLLRANRNNGYIRLAANNQPHTFNMSNFQDRLNQALDYQELCQHQPYRCNEGDSYGGEYGGEY